MVKKVKWAVSGREVDDTEDDSYDVYEGQTPPKGVYVAKIKSVKQAESSNGNDMIKVLLIVDGKRSGKGKGQYDGAPIFDNVTVTEAAMFRVKQFMTGLGATGKDFDRTAVDDDGNIVKFGAVRPVGMLVRVMLKQEFYADNNEWSAKVARYLPPKDEEPEEDEPDEDDTDDDEPDEDEDDTGDEDDEDDEDEAPPPRRAAKKAPAPAKKTAAAAKRAPAKKAAAPSRKRSSYDEEPPF